jgi:hypothetical protein
VVDVVATRRLRMRRWSPMQETILHVALERDESGYPPFDAEEIVAVVVEEDDHWFRVTGIPCFVRGLARDDIVEVRHFEGHPWIEHLVLEGGHSTFHLIQFGDNDLSALLLTLERLGCETAASCVRGLLGTVVPADADIIGVVTALLEARANGVADFDMAVLAKEHDADLGSLGE